MKNSPAAFDFACISTWYAQKIYDAHHPAVLRMIEYVIKNAHENNVTVGICGELGSDIALINKFIEMGIDELSVVPSMILEVRQAVIGSD